LGAGAVVSGSDLRASATLDELAADGVVVEVGHEGLAGRDAAVVLWSPAVPTDDPELVAARARGARLVSRAQLLADLAETTEVVGLTGTHGKTTATSMMVHVMSAAGRDPARLVGAPVPGVGANGHFGPDGLILEVDESYGTFARLRPAALGLLNVEADHLDHYGDVASLEAEFVALVDRTTGPVVAWVDDPGAGRVASAAARDVVTVGATPRASWRVEGMSSTRAGSSFSLHHGGDSLEVALRVPGAHVGADAAVVAALALTLGVDARAVATGLSRFEGSPRRFARRGSWRGVDVYEDYAHLPGEIAATLAALSDVGYRSVTALFQPHRVTRTLALAEEFAPSFDGAARVVVTDLYAAGEANPTGVSGELVAAPLRARRDGVVYAPRTADAVAALVEWHDVSDVIVVLGAGDVARVIDDLDGGVA
ncbi:MAG: UDP-N-acetylmuramate--L-alanine ligase, partial [Acidimicrobiales bacterium]